MQFDILISNLSNPVLLFFLLGVVASLVKSDLEVPATAVTRKLLGGGPAGHVVGSGLRSASLWLVGLGYAGARVREPQGDPRLLSTSGTPDQWCKIDGARQSAGKLDWRLGRTMEWLNYHHLLYFHTIAREGSIAAAAKTLRLAQPTISGQLKLLEDQLGVQLFDRKGRGLDLTDAGRKVFRYADEIFAIGNELKQAVRGGKTDDAWNLRVGIVDVVPKLITYRLIEPALTLSTPVRVVCNEGKAEDLLEQLARNRLDLVVSDTPASRTGELQVFNHLLGETTVSVFGTTDLAANFRRGLPGSLDGAPLLLPTRGCVLRGLLDALFSKQKIIPNIVAEFEDSALAKVFGQSGRGLFFAPTAISDEICKTFEVECLGELPSLKERFFAISVERRLKNPAVTAITEIARNELFR